MVPERKKRMARVTVKAKGSEAKGSERQSLALFSKEKKSKRRKRRKGYYAGRLARIMGRIGKAVDSINEEMEMLYSRLGEGKEDAAKLQISRIPESSLPPDSVGKPSVDFKKICHIKSGLVGKGGRRGRQTNIKKNCHIKSGLVGKGGRRGRQTNIKKICHIKSGLVGKGGRRGRQKNNKRGGEGLRRSRVSDDILSGELEDFGRNPLFSSTSAAAENHNKRRKVAAAPVPAAAELQLVPFRGLSPSAALAGPLSVETIVVSPNMEDGKSLSSLHSFPEHRIGTDELQNDGTEAEVDLEDPPICIICDDGGNLIYCDGPCHRYFHPTKRSGSGSTCKTLGLTEAEVESMGKFYCPNCKHCQQQCFICDKLGSSVATSHGPPEVRCCDIPFCKRFFHVDCAAEALCGRDWRGLADDINNGVQKLYCPRHFCVVCGDAEMEEPGRMVQCRRCPQAWHRHCLDSVRSEQQSPVIWNQHNRAFIYCRDHKILPKLKAPRRNHIRFPSSRS